MPLDGHTNKQNLRNATMLIQPRVLRHCLRAIRFRLSRHPQTTLSLITSALLFLLVYLSLRSASSESFRISVSSINITPPFPVPLSGFATRNLTPSSVALLHASLPLRARVLFLRASSRSPPLLLVSLDLIGVTPNFTSSLRHYLHSTHALPASSLHLFPSHTHSGPSLPSLLPSLSVASVLTARYEQWLHSTLAALIDDVLRSRQRPVSVQWASSVWRRAVNRLHVDEYRFNAENRGYTDDRVRALVFRDVHGEIVAGMYGYAAHPTVQTSGIRYSGDYVGFASNTLERNIGGVWLFVQGCAGDQNIYPRGETHMVEQYGTELANVVLALVKEGKGEIVGDGIRANEGYVKLEFARRRRKTQLRRINGREIWLRKAIEDVIGRIDKGMQSRDVYERFPVAAVRVGNKRMVLMGGEPTVGLCEKVEMETGVDWVIGYVDDVMGYVYTDKQGEMYAEKWEKTALYYGLPDRWKNGTEQRIVDKVKNVVDGME